MEWWPGKAQRLLYTAKKDLRAYCYRCRCFEAFDWSTAKFKERLQPTFAVFWFGTLAFVLAPSFLARDFVTSRRNYWNLIKETVQIANKLPRRLDSFLRQVMSAQTRHHFTQPWRPRHIPKTNTTISPPPFTASTFVELLKQRKCVPIASRSVSFTGLTTKWRMHLNEALLSGLMCNGFFGSRYECRRSIFTPVKQCQ